MSSERGNGTSDYERVLSFWFGELDGDGLADRAHSAQWWKKSDELDAEIRERFGADHEAIHAGKCGDWLESPRGRLAYVIVLDQFSRNMYRDTSAMFASDERALAVALEGVEQRHDDALATDERVFLYMPLMHAEQQAMQERCVALFAALREGVEGPARERVDGSHHFAVRHRDIVARFGRFPHRNAILTRCSSDDEQAFLKQPGSSF